jgi:hypothetical protein
VPRHDPDGPTRNAVDISTWLRELGLERYETAFRDNDIDGEVLPELADADLEKLGVSLGHRKKMLPMGDIRCRRRNRGDAVGVSTNATICHAWA